jgi:dTDP-4-dehydrorhamnose reductase
MKVMITGASGLLGKALIATAPSEYELCLTYHNHKPNGNYETVQFDLSKDVNLDEIRPDIIIHCAAIGSVDEVQKNFVYGIKINLFSTINLIKEAERIGTKFIFISTNAVYNGTNPLYNEEDDLSPVNYYGLFKANAELSVRSSDLDWIIIRPILMYGWPNSNQRGNWVTTWINKMSKGEMCEVVDDVTTQPLYNIDCAIVIWKAIIGEKYKQIFNISGADRLTLYEFAIKVAESIDADIGLVKPVSSHYFANLAPRPKDTSFNLHKMRTVLKHKTLGVVDGMAMMLRDKWMFDHENKKEQ